MSKILEFKPRENRQAIDNDRHFDLPENYGPEDSFVFHTKPKTLAFGKCLEQAAPPKHGKDKPHKFANISLIGYGQKICCEIEAKTEVCSSPQELITLSTSLMELAGALQAKALALMSESD